MLRVFTAHVEYNIGNAILSFRFRRSIRFYGTTVKTAEGQDGGRQGEHRTTDIRPSIGAELLSRQLLLKPPQTDDCFRLQNHRSLREV